MRLLPATIAAVAIAACNKDASDYVRKAKSIEARVSLRRLARALEEHHAEHARFPIATAPLTPAGPCCEHPDQECPLDRAAWQAEPWRTLSFEQYSDHRFRFDYASTDGSTFVARAVADLDCRGDRVTFTLRGRIDGDRAVTELDDPLRPGAR